MKQQFLTLLLLLISASLFSQAYEGTLLSQWKDDSLVSSSAYDNTYNEVWGISVNNLEYAIIGSTKGTHFINVTDPTNIFEQYVIEGAAQGPEIIHRDYHDFDKYLYAVADEGLSSTLQIIDISVLPSEPIVVYDQSNLIRTSHNIFIDESDSRLYALATSGSETGYGAIKVFDLANPIDPVEIYNSNNIQGFNFGHVHDAQVNNNIAFLNCGYDGFAIADFTDITDVKLLGSLRTNEYPQSGYNHSGWPSEDGNYYFMADETWSKDIKTLDFTDFPDISIPNTFNAESTSEWSIPHNQIVEGNYLYVSYYYDGLQVYDISNPLDISRIMYFHTSNRTHSNTYEGAWGVYPFLPSGIILVSDMQEGLFVIEGIKPSSTNPESQKEENISIYPNPANQTININVPKIGKYTISNISGKSVLSGEMTRRSNNTVDLPLASGFYIFTLTTMDNNIYTKKLVISK